MLPTHAASDLEDTWSTPIRQFNYKDACLLVVEDQDDLWVLFQFALRKQLPGVELHRTSSQLQTVAFLKDRLTRQLPLPKLILQDLYMPDRKAGLDLLGDTRLMLAQHQPIPIIVVSSSTDPEDIQQTYRHGATYYVVKPTGVPQWLTFGQGLRSFWWELGVWPIH